MLKRGTLPTGTPQSELGPGSYHYRKLPFKGIIQEGWDDDKVGRFIRAMRFPGYEGAAVIIGGEKVFVDSVWEYRWFLGKTDPLPALQGKRSAAECESTAVDSESAPSGDARSI